MCAESLAKISQGVQTITVQNRRDEFVSSKPESYLHNGVYSPPEHQQNLTDTQHMCVYVFINVVDTFMIQTLN